MQFSRRTTGITNLSVKDYLARLIPVPDRSAQAQVVEIADAFDARLTNVTAELRDLRAFRSTLVTALLSQAVSVPASYDELLNLSTTSLDAELAGAIR